MKSDQLLKKIRPLERNPNVSEQLAEHLARHIADGTLAPETRLPGEVELSRRLGVSRPTLREALGALKSRGLVEVRPRSGTYVAQRARERSGETLAQMIALDPAKIWELLEIRKILDAECAALAARRRTPADVSRLRELLHSVQGESGASLISRGEGARFYARFFLTIVQATHNSLMSHQAEGVADLQRDGLTYSRAQLATRPDSGEAIFRQLEAIFQAVEAGDGDSARRATREHLEWVESTLKEIEAQAVEVA